LKLRTEVERRINTADRAYFLLLSLDKDQISFRYIKIRIYKILDPSFTIEQKYGPSANICVNTCGYLRRISVG
jgi:hypothetical protein